MVCGSNFIRYGDSNTPSHKRKRTTTKNKKNKRKSMHWFEPSLCPCLVLVFSLLSIVKTWSVYRFRSYRLQLSMASIKCHIADPLDQVLTEALVAEAVAARPQDPLDVALASASSLNSGLSQRCVPGTIEARLWGRFMRARQLQAPRFIHVSDETKAQLFRLPKLSVL